MSYNIGIIGLPNAGKSTLFKLLTEAEVDIDSYPFTTIDPNVGMVKIPDERVDKIAKATGTEEKIYPVMKFVDIAGLIEGAHKGEGLGNKFLSHVKGCSALIHVIGSFDQKNPDEGEKIIQKELLMKDLELTEKLIGKVKNEEKLSIIKKIKGALMKNQSFKDLNLTEEEIEKIKEYQFLTLKPIFKLYNGPGPGFSIDLKLEEEIKELTDEEKRQLGVQSRLDDFLVECYNAFDLITFFTVAGRKVQGWAIEKGATASEAAEKVHSDFKEDFKRAEITGPEDIISAKSFKKARNAGKVKAVGADYKIKNGDVIEFKI